MEGDLQKTLPCRKKGDLQKLTSVGLREIYKKHSPVGGSLTVGAGGTAGTFTSKLT